MSLGKKVGKKAYEAAVGGDEAELQEEEAGSGDEEVSAFMHLLLKNYQGTETEEEFKKTIHNSWNEFQKGRGKKTTKSMSTANYAQICQEVAERLGISCKGETMEGIAKKIKGQLDANKEQPGGGGGVWGRVCVAGKEGGKEGVRGRGGWR